MKIAIIDDERPARSELIHYLHEILPDADVMEADSGAAGLELISNHPFQLIFLDIELGDINGTSLAVAIKQILPDACIVFATAFSDYAVKAFQIGVSNYILKPFSKEQLQTVIDQCREKVIGKAERPVVTKLPITSNRKVVMVDIDQIVFVETENRGCLVHTTEGDFKENITIGEYEKRLQGHRFYRIHKCYIINLDQIHEIIPWHNNSLALKMFGYESEPIPVARNNVKTLKQMIGI